MAIKFRTNAPTWFKVVAIVLLLWGLAGLSSLYPHFRYDPAIDPKATDWDRANMPAPLWLNAVYVSAVFAGLLASVGLLMRKRWAVTLSMLSLLLVVVQFGYVFLATGIIAGKGLWTIYFPAFVFVMQIVQLWVATKGRARGWLN